MAVQNAAKKTTISFEVNKSKKTSILFYQDILKEQDKLMITYLQTKAVMNR